MKPLKDIQSVCPACGHENREVTDYSLRKHMSWGGTDNAEVTRTEPWYGLSFVNEGLARMIVRCNNCKYEQRFLPNNHEAQS